MKSALCFGIVAFCVVSSSYGQTPATIEGRYLFYNQSKYDGNRVAIDTGIIPGGRNDDSDAIDTTKYPLLPGAGSAVFANESAYSKGINGLMFDVMNTGRPLTLGDFAFTNIGKQGTAGTAISTAGFGFRVIAGIGVNASDRVVITIPNNTITKTWLQIDITAEDILWDANAIKTCYWANAIGETGSWTGTPPNVYMTVNATDELSIRTHPMINPATPTPVSNPYAIVKNGLVQASDQLAARANKDITPTSGVKVIWR